MLFILFLNDQDSVAVYLELYKVQGNFLKSQLVTSFKVIAIKNHDISKHEKNKRHK